MTEITVDEFLIQHLEVPEDKFTKSPKGIIIDDFSLTEDRIWSTLPVKFYHCHGGWSCKSSILENMTNFPSRVDGGFSIGNCRMMKTLKGLPQYIGGACYLPNFIDSKFSIDEYRYAFLSQIGGLINIRNSNPEPITQEIEYILEVGRVAGVMPSELIPGKIKELRDLANMRKA